MSRPPLQMGRTWPDVVDLVVFDFDGVMTDNTVLVFEDGREAVRCHRGDGLGIAMLLAAGFRAMVLSTEANPVVGARAAKMHLPVQQDCPDKRTALEKIMIGDRIDPARVVYVGNDINDLDCLRLVGLPVVVADAVDEARAEAALVLRARGGQGAVRELCDLLIRFCAAGAAPSSAGDAGGHPCSVGPSPALSGR